MRNIGTVTMATKLKYAEASLLAEIDIKVLAHFLCL